MEEELKPGIYQHFKGSKVKVHYIGTHSETLEKMVIYEKLEDGHGHLKGEIWVRPLQMFEETVERDGKVYQRFKYLE